MKLYEKLVDDLVRLIESEVLRPGERLPSIRQLARSRSISPGTVLQAYGVLEDKGIVEARARSGYFVASQAKELFPVPETYQPGSLSTPVDVSELVFRILEAAKDRHVVPFGSAFPSPLLFPLRQLSHAMSRAIRTLDPWRTVEDLPPGNRQLRRLISRRYLDSGCTINQEGIVITSGALEGLNLCLQAVTSPGDIVAVESPTFYGALQAIEAHSLRVVEIPTDPRYGVKVDALEQALKRHPIRACWFMTNFQNPLGSLMPEENKRALVELLNRCQVPLIEDDVYGELFLRGERPPPAKAFDTEDLVLHCSSFSKCLAPGFRVGWAAPGRYTRQVRQRKLITTLSATIPAQAALVTYLERGGYERHLRRLRHALASQQHAMLTAINRYFPSGCRVTCPDGGYFLWLELPTETNSVEVHRRAMEAGISVSPGPMFSAHRGFRNRLRLNYGHGWSQRKEEAMQALGAIIADHDG
ncbi:PLP-dependent aminotransferase family protein [Methylonatrum kenyense]|uniref:aminotransferase-like domain-containing protein n=1 Tax=Methylonatrum kenyense TaxID=455253 RepID=UPI0020C07A4F|nr:PLP-dependent aminotransferase family protein [Methylonatrum kenyense]MCK8516512.1 PLP-dependent aminotransferase family protein [Methylonatrum kenyense]